MNINSKQNDLQVKKPVPIGQGLLESYVQKDKFLARLEELVPWEELRKTLENTIEDEAIGRKGYDKLALFKCLVLQETYGLSDKALEAELQDRLSFRYFVGVDLSPTVPDRLTIMRFRNRLATNDSQRGLFTQFYSSLEKQGLAIYSGTNAPVAYAKAPRLRKARVKSSAR